MLGFALGVMVGTLVFIVIPEIIYRHDYGLSVWSWKRKRTGQ